MRRRNPFLSACGSIVLLCLFSYGIASCNGNGGSHDGGGPVYTPGATSSGSGTTENSGSTISADELLALSNGGDTGAILSRFSGPNASTATTTVSFSSSVLGLPAGGYVTLVITGQGIAYTADATDSGSGTVSFTIPQIASGTEITVSIIVKKADGTVVCAGSKTQTVTGNVSDIQVPLIDEGPWTLPASLAVNASPSTITYDAGLYAATPPGSQTVTFSVAGLSAPPSGSISYEWSLPTGAPLGSGDSISLDLRDDLLGSTPTAGGLYSCGIIVTATYTDEEGAVTTASGTGVAAVTVLEIPAFTIEVTLPAGVTAHKNAAGTVVADSYDIADLSKTFKFTATATAGAGYPAGTFPDGTEFEWETSYDSTIAGGFDSTSSTGQPDHFDVQPSGLNSLYSQWYATDTPPKTFYIACNAENGKAINSPKSAASSKTISMYKPKLPKPTISYRCTAGVDRTAATSLLPATFYAPAGSTDPKTDTEFSFEIGNASTFPADAKWKLVAGSRAYGVGIATSAAATARDDQLNYVALNSLTDAVSAPYTTNAIKLVVECPSYVSSESDALTFIVYNCLPASIGSFSTELSCTGNPVSLGLGNPPGYEVGDTSTFSGSLILNFPTTSLPDAGSGAKYEWYVRVNLAPTDPDPVDSVSDSSTGFAGFAVKDYVAIDSLPTYTDPTSTGVRFTLRCWISFPGTTSPALNGYAESTIYLFKQSP